MDGPSAEPGPAPRPVEEQEGLPAALDDGVDARERWVGQGDVALGRATDGRPVPERHAEELLPVAEEGELRHGAEG